MSTIRYSHPLWSTHLFGFYWHWWHIMSWNLISSMWRSPFYMVILNRRSTSLSRWGSNCRKGEYGMQAEEIVLWIKIITKAVVQAFHSFIRGKKYTRSHYVRCVYYNKLPSGKYIYLLLYVDDMFIAFKSSLQLINWRKTCLLNSRWKIWVKKRKC